MSNMITHSYHLVEESWWPFFSSLASLGLTCGLVKWFSFESAWLMFLSLILLISISFQWWRDISREGSLQGLHSPAVELGLRWGMILFITSEVLFFFSFFWAFFHSSFSSALEIGGVWPSVGVKPFNPLEIPLLNSLILLSSGFSVTWSHHAIMGGDYSGASISLKITIILGMYFTALQSFEYLEAPFSISDSIYGSVFYIATGFHGVHVIVGTLFLMVCLLRLSSGQLSMAHHFGFEAAAWYWHFVDVVWLFLYLSIYWWGS